MAGEDIFRRLLDRTTSLSLFARDTSPASAWQVIGWWELRRIPYNLIVACAGVLTCTFVAIVALASSILFGKDFGLPNPPIFGIILIFVYAIAANMCYTAGWMTELIMRTMWPRGTDKFATWTFSLGVIFSVIVTLLPCVVIGGSGAIQLWHHFHRATQQ